MCKHGECLFSQTNYGLIGDWMYSDSKDDSASGNHSATECEHDGEQDDSINVGQKERK